MMQFLLSPAAMKPLAVHRKPQPHVHPDLIWRADLKLIGADPCMVLQEQHSQYIMVLCGLTQENFRDFPTLIQDRFWREATALCKQANLFDTPVLAKHLNDLAGTQHYLPDPEPPEEGKLLKVMEKLERRFLYDRQPLPKDGKEAFAFGFQINTRLPKIPQMQGQSNPAEVLGNLCLNLVETAVEQERKANDPVVSVEDNIVTVNFGQRQGSQGTKKST